MRRSAIAVAASALASCTCDTRVGAREPIVEVPARGTPPAVEFGAVPVNSTATRQLAVHNVGSAPLTVSSLAVPLPFVTPSSGAVIAPGETRSFDVVYTPKKEGSESERDAADITVVSDDPEKPQVAVPVSGWGIKAAAAIDPAALGFGDVYVGEDAALSWTITNAGSDAFAVNDARLEGTATAEFTVGTGNADLARLKGTYQPGSSTTVTVHLSPTSMGPKAAELVLDTSVASQATIRVPLTGRGTQALLKVCFKIGSGAETCLDEATRAGTLDFGGVAEGQSATAPINVVNDGNVPVLVSGVMIDQTTKCVAGQPSDFTFTPSALPASIQAGGRVLVTVVYAPTHRCAGDLADNASVVVFRGDSRPPASLSVGILGASRIGRLKVTDETFNTIGAQPISAAYAVYNVGAGDLNVSGVELVAGDPSAGAADGGCQNATTTCANGCATRPTCRAPDGGALAGSPECAWFRFVPNAGSWTVGPQVGGTPTPKDLGSLTFASPVPNPPKTSCVTCMRVVSDDPVASTQCGKITGNN